MEATVTKEGKKTQTKIGTKLKCRRIFRKLFAVFLIMAFLAGAVWYLYSSLQEQYTITYQPYTASIGTISNALSFNGTLQAIHSASYTAGSSGTVRAVYTPAGTQVKAGDKLLRLSTGQVVEAEFDGEVNVMNFTAGESVSAGDILCQVVDFQHLKTSIRVDEYDINHVQVGDLIRVTTTANEKEFESTVAAINHTSSSSGSVAYYTATAYIDVEEGVYPGMQVTVTLPMEEAADVVILKMSAISFDEENKAFVYTMDEKGEIQKTYITTGVSNGSYTEIRSGLRDGDTVYTEVQTETTNAVTSLFGSLFGQTRMMDGSGGQFGRDEDRSSNAGNMPGFGGGTDSNRDSERRNGSGNGFGGGNR